MMIYIFLKLVLMILQLHYSILFHCATHLNTSKSTSFNLRKINKSFPPLSKTKIHIPTKKNVTFLKNKFCNPKYVHKSFVHCLHIQEVSLPVPVTAICVVSSPLLVSANINIQVLIAASTVSVTSDVTIQSVTSVSICRSVCKNQRKTFLYLLSTLLLYPNVCNIAPPTCISVNWVKTLLNVIKSNVHKTVVSYKAVQSFCTDVVVQNVNVLSSPTCKVLCFKKNHHVSPINCFMLETYSLPVTSSKLPSSSPLSPSSSSLSSLSSVSTSSSSPLLLNPPSSSPCSVSFYISSTSEVTHLCF